MLNTVTPPKVAPYALIVLSIIGIALAWLSSFRLGFGNVDIAWQSNLDRSASAVAAGLAFAGVGALGKSSSKVNLHITAFAILAATASFLLLGSLLQWQLGLSITAAGVAGMAVYLIIKYTSQKKSANLWAALILTLAFLLCVLNFFAASTVGGVIGSLVFWLQGDLARAGAYSSLALLLSLILFAWMLLSKSKDMPASMLIGLAIGVAGPVLFISWLVPQLVRKLTKIQGEWFIIVCGVVGALSILLADAVPRLLLGGYSPTLIVPIALVSIPILLTVRRAESLWRYPSPTRSMFEAGFIAVWVVGFIAVLYHVIKFAGAAT